MTLPMPCTPGKRIAAIILAAGASSRMGYNKLLVEIGGECIIRRVARTVIASDARPVVIVTGGEFARMEQALSGLVLRVVNNPDFQQGLSTSLRTGIGALTENCDGSLIVLGDMPAISRDLLNRLIASFDPARGKAICVAMHAGRRGNPVLLGRKFFPDLLELTGDMGARRIVANNDDVIAEVEADDDAPLVDIDTPAALATFLARGR